MGRFVNDMNQVGILLESGTYANPTGTSLNWPGMVQSLDVTDNQNIILTRFLGLGNKNVGTFEDGPRDIEGTINLFPQDWRLLGLAIGSITTTSGTSQSSNYRFDLAQQVSSVRHNAFTSGAFNPWMSFTLEAAGDGPTANQNFIRTYKGCVVNQYTLNIEQGEPVSVDISFMAQTGSFTSGGITSLQNVGSNRPYLWSDVIFQIDGTTVDELRSLTFNYNNNFDGPHYINGSRVIGVPIPTNVDCSVNITQDAESTSIGSYAHVMHLGGSKFNALIDINNTINTGSHRLQITLSGCEITEFGAPFNIDGVTQINYTFVPGSVSAISFDRLPLYTAF